MSIGILLYLDLEFWEGTLKTLTPSLQENAKYFTTRSYLTLTIIIDNIARRWNKLVNKFCEVKGYDIRL